MKLSSLATTPLIKGLCVGDSGTGKTGSLASLAKAGFHLRIIDTDKGTDILASLLRDDPAALERVEVARFSNKTKVLGGGIKPTGVANAYLDAVKQISEWVNSPEMDHSHILVIDSLTRLSQYCLQFMSTFSPGKTGGVEIQHYLAHNKDMENLFGLLVSDEVRCHVLIMTHITYVMDEMEISKPYPMAVGSKFPTEIAGHFNNMIGYRVLGQKREIVTSSMGTMGLKTASPTTVQKSYPLETGLASFFSDMGAKP